MGTSNQGTVVSEELFSELVQQHWPRLVREAEKYRGRAETAEDIVQNAVVNAWRHLDQLKDPKKADRWLGKFVCFAGLKSVTKRARRRKLLEGVGLPERGHAKSPEEVLALKLEDEALDRAIDDLPESWRSVILCRLAGLSVSETSARLEMAVGTVKSYTHRAISALRETLAET